MFQNNNQMKWQSTLSLPNTSIGKKMTSDDQLKLATEKVLTRPLAVHPARILVAAFQIIPGIHQWNFYPTLHRERHETRRGMCLLMLRTCHSWSRRFGGRLTPRSLGAELRRKNGDSAVKETWQPWKSLQFMDHFWQLEICREDLQDLRTESTNPTACLAPSGTTTGAKDQDDLAKKNWRLGGPEMVYSLVNSHRPCQIRVGRSVSTGVSQGLC